MKFSLAISSIVAALAVELALEQARRPRGRPRQDRRCGSGRRSLGQRPSRYLLFSGLCPGARRFWLPFPGGHPPLAPVAAASESSARARRRPERRRRRPRLRAGSRLAPVRSTTVDATPGSSPPSSRRAAARISSGTSARCAGRARRGGSRSSRRRRRSDRGRRCVDARQVGDADPDRAALRRVSATRSGAPGSAGRACTGPGGARRERGEAAAQLRDGVEDHVEVAREERDRLVARPLSRRAARRLRARRR